MHSLRLAVIIVSLVVYQGCAPVVLTVGSQAMDAGIEHTMNGIVYKTFTSPLPNLRLASLKALNWMDMKVTKDNETAYGREIEALASDRTIDIKLESLTDKTTSMRVIVNRGDFFFKDSATAREIIIQIVHTLEEEIARAEQAGE